MLRKYYDLTKPGIIYGNLMTATAGFLLASHARIYLGLLTGTVVGIALVIASGCVINNVIDRKIDKKMDRTKKRALVSGDISVHSALIYAGLLGATGFSVLAISTNWLTVVIGLIGFVDYVVLYGYAKRHSPWGTLVGSISGSMPLVAGYTAVSNSFDSGALWLFLAMVFWQMPHFYAIAIRRFEDYKRAALPVLPVARGTHRTKVRMMLYIAAFMLACFMLTVEGYTGLVFAFIMVGLSITWLRRGLTGFDNPDEKQWARRMFMFSLVVLMALSVMLPLGTLLP